MTGRLESSADLSVGFALAHVLSILYLSDVSVRLVRWQSSDDPRISAMKIPPPAALYDKAVCTSRGLKKLSRSKLSWKATSACIRALISLAESLKGTDHWIMPGTFADEIEAIPALQLQYCLDHIPKGIYGIDDLAAVLEAGAGYLLTCGNGPADLASKFEPGLHALYERLTSEHRVQSMSTMELACISKAIAAWDLYKQKSDQDLFLSEIVLEIISRKSISGLLGRQIYDTGCAAMGQQFFILDALAVSYPFVRLEVIRNRMLEIFERLYSIAYREIPGAFSFWRKDAAISAFAAGAVVSCLGRISRFYSDTAKKEVLLESRHTAVDLLIRPYIDRYSSPIRKAVKWYRIMQDTVNAGIHPWPNLCPVFSKKVPLSPDTRLEHSCKGMVRLADLMYLCASLLQYSKN